MSPDAREAFVRQLLSVTSECGAKPAMSLFRVAPGTSRASVRGMDEASDWADANITADWALGQIGPAIDDAYTTIDGWIASDGKNLMSIFVLQASAHVADIRAAAYAGCASMVLSNLSNIRDAAIFGFGAGGPVTALGNAGAVTMGYCAVGALAGGLSAYLAYRK